MRVIQVSAHAPSDRVIAEAADLLRSGGLVAFPTETVYGLGANALDARAVGRIYEAKGRPGGNPLIVHVAGIAEARALSAEWTTVADALAEAFWPGPLTLVVRKADVIPAVVSAGGETVGLRMPAHAIALALLRAAGIPVAAPSANRSTEVSPTTAQHVVDSLGDRVELILDGGATLVGIESTVVDATGSVPRILRPGMISADHIGAIAGIGKVVSTVGTGGDTIRSPGLLGKHYAPRGTVRLFDRTGAARAASDARAALEEGTRVAAMVFASLELPGLREIVMPAEPAAYARVLYATLHALDADRCETILVERPRDTHDWAAILDRLERASRG